MPTLMRYNAATGTSDVVMPSPMGTAYALMNRTTNQSIPTGTITQVTMSLVSVGYHGSVTSGGFAPNVNGIYVISSSIQWDNSSTAGRRNVSIYLDSTQLAVQDGTPINLSTNNTFGTSITTYVEAGQLITTRCYQNSGAALNVNGDALRCWMTVARCA